MADLINFGGLGSLGSLETIRDLDSLLGLENTRVLGNLGDIVT